MLRRRPPVARLCETGLQVADRRLLVTAYDLRVQHAREGIGTPRRTGEQTKDLLLRTATAMLLDRGISAGVSHIRLQEVVRRAGLTTGAAYRLWVDQDAFHHDLAVAAARWRGDVPAAVARERIGDLLRRQVPLMEVVRQGAQSHVDTFDEDEQTRRRSARSFLMALALRASSAGWSDLRDASVARHTESVREFAALYGMVMDVYRRRMRAPLTIEDFSTAMAALGEGFALHAIQGVPHPHIQVPGPAGVGDDWTLFGISAWALIQGYTEPAVDPDPPGDTHRAGQGPPIGDRQA